MTPPLRVGIIGLDTSHVTAFTSLLNDPAAEHHVPGARVVAAYAGFSEDWEASRSRVKGFTDEVRDKYGVAILPTPEDVASQCDLIFLESADGRVHLDLFKRIVPFKKPVFIDKPLALTSVEARQIVRLAADAGIAMMSSSTLRFIDNFAAALAAPPDNQPVVGVHVFGPLSFQPTQPGWFWYGIHSVEMLVAAMGTGCRSLRVQAADSAEILVAAWSDGRVASIRATRTQTSNYACTIHYPKTFRFIDISLSQGPFYAPLLRQIMANLPLGKSAVPIEQTLEVIRILEAANQSRENGREVTL